MQAKTKIAVLAVFAAMAIYGAEATNEFGVYKLPLPQTTYSSDKQRNDICRGFGNDYRVPTIEELFNAPDDLKEKSEKSLYASSTRNPQNNEEIYYHSFDNRDVNIVGVKENLYLVCFKENGKKQVKNLVWAKGERNRMEYKEAKVFCEAKGERLPSAKELFSLAIEKLKDEKAFAVKYGFTQPKYYWSSDVNNDFSNTAIVVGFMRASVASSAKDNKSFVRCVKDGK